MMPTRRSFSLGLLGLAALPAACASPSPVLYTLDAVPGGTRPGAPALVLLQDVAVAPYLDRKAIVRSSGGYHIAVSQNDWWGEPFSAMLGRVLSAELEQRLPGCTVYTEGGAVSATPQATVALNVTRFDETEGGQVVLVAQASVTFAVSTRPPVTEAWRFTVPVVGQTVTDQVAAMSTALGQLADRLAQALAS
ncbi:PqiC family protein [Acidisoma sp. 7E03]